MKPRNGDMVILDKSNLIQWNGSRCLVLAVNKATETAYIRIVQNPKGEFIEDHNVEHWCRFEVLTVVFTKINFTDLIDMTLDSGDEKWFLEVTEFKKHYDKVLFSGGALSGKE